MKVMIRRATTDDAGVIASLAADALETQIDADSPRVHKILNAGLTFVATHNEAIVGFASGFYTLDRHGSRRYELDLLAVALDARGRGIGGRLVEANLFAAGDSKPQLIRALVRSDNRSMQRLCRRHSFAVLPRKYELFVAVPRSVVRKTQKHQALLIPVETLNYSGIWLEGELSQAAINVALSQAAQSDMSTIGAVIPSDASLAIELLRRNSFENVGEYDWWTINSRSG